METGFLVALVNRFDPDHQRCAAVWEPLRGEVLTVEGALVEAAWMLRKVPAGPRTAIELVLAAGVTVVGATEARLRRALSLMERYDNVPMDLVDAQLVALGEESQTRQVLTLDRRGFRTYRGRGLKAFELLPA